ncbi:MAG: DUF2807 domain-containing protein [Bacteroidales bacterium]|nr:DUF2807 domain-containing protein [Bacteroidales bacterium]
MIKRTLTSICMIAATLFFSNAASAQTKEIEHEFSAFNAIEVSNAFEVTLVSGESHSAVLTVDGALAELAKAYVKGKTLYIDLDEKNMSKETKALYKGKNAPVPVLKAVIRVPQISSITIAEDVVLGSAEPINAEKFTLSTSGSAQVKALSVNADKVTISSDKKSSINMTVSSNDIDVNTSGSSSFKLSYDCKDLKMSTSGSSEVSVSGSSKNVSLSTAGSSKLTLAGQADNLDVKGAGSSNINAINLPVKDCSVVLSGSCTVTENASNNLKMELSGNSTLIFNGDPKIDIVNIKSSTVQHYNQ